jgi:hypothetical protein
VPRMKALEPRFDKLRSIPGFQTAISESSLAKKVIKFVPIRWFCSGRTPEVALLRALLITFGVNPTLRRQV